MGYSWGGYESLILPTDPAPLAGPPPSGGQRGPSLRLHAGLENVDDLIADLEKGLGAAEKKPDPELTAEDELNAAGGAPPAAGSECFSGHSRLMLRNGGFKNRWS